MASLLYFASHHQGKKQNQLAEAFMSARRHLVLLGLIVLLLLSVRLLYSNSTLVNSSVCIVSNTKTSQDVSALSIRPGALPSYTGWGRAESTLAPFFRIVSFPPTSPTDTVVKFRLECEGSSLCSTAAPAFFVRAYGPSVIAGQVTRVPRSDNQFEVLLRPIDPGKYHVEVVLTFSNLPDFASFPLPDEESYRKFLYEGYHVMGSPFPLSVTGKPAPSPKDFALCRPDQLVESAETNNSEHGRARWRVVDAVNHREHQLGSLVGKNVSLQGYQNSLNSIGIMMDYQFKDCRLMPEPTPKVNLFQCVREPIHIVMIGDSTFRLQEKLIQNYVAFNPLIRVSFLELYGGYLKTQILSGPNVRQFLTEAALGPERRIVLFNTGLHDIHRLCGGSTMFEDRKTYLRSDMSGACVDLYKIAISSLVEEIMKLPETDMKIFQTTTAGWPKYGNYGFAWDPRYGQPLPLDTSFVEYFNQVAITTLQKFPSIQIVDGYHVSHARPDHREIDSKSAIGRKLSHPGLEVISAMVRTWSLLFLQQVCH